MVAERAGVGANLDDWLDFSPDSVTHVYFSLPLEPPSAPSALCSAWGRRAQKQAEPADFGVLRVRLDFFFDVGVEKVALGDPLGAQLKLLLANLTDGPVY